MDESFHIDVQVWADKVRVIGEGGAEIGHTKKRPESPPKSRRSSRTNNGTLGTDETEVKEAWSGGLALHPNNRQVFKKTLPLLQFISVEKNSPTYISSFNGARAKVNDRALLAILSSVLLLG